jgi:hypothetical protein
VALNLVWDQCFVGELERQRFRDAIEAEGKNIVTVKLCAQVMKQ